MLHIELSYSNRDSFVRAMSRAANSMAVVTTDGTGGGHGATVSAFSSVSADKPIILVCLRSGGQIAEAISANGTLCANVLPHDRPHTANRFVRRDDNVSSVRYQCVDLIDAAGAATLIYGVTVIVGVFDQAIAVGSDIIFICQLQMGCEGRAAPLAYFDGCYHNVVLQVT